MKRSVTTTRLYSLGNYQNISFSDTIEDIPENVAFDNEAMKRLRSIQLFQIEKSYLKYFKLKETTHKLSTDEAMELIEELDVTSSKKFKEIFYDAPVGDTPEEGEEKII